MEFTQHHRTELGAGKPSVTIQSNTLLQVSFGGWGGTWVQQEGLVTPGPATRVELPLGRRNAHTSLKPWGPRGRGPPWAIPLSSCLSSPRPSFHPEPQAASLLPSFLWPLHCFRIKVLWEHTHPRLSSSKIKTCHCFLGPPEHLPPTIVN